ncbi:MAG: hypothetical protein AAGE59_30905 [Cyanobacteria bacterium P01_F01_bin.86]
MVSTSPKHKNTPVRTAFPVPLVVLALISSLLLLLVGGSLFFFPDVARSRWVWSLTPFNTRFLGAIYLTAFVGLAILLVTRRALPARLIVLMTWVFTSVVLLVSCLQTGQFNLARRATALWFGLYAADCLGSSYYLWHYGRRRFTELKRLPRYWVLYLQLQAGLLGVYGLGLLFLPVQFGLVWPWPLDAFHSQLYSSIFLVGAAGAALLAWQTTAAELWALGTVQIALSSFVIAGVAIVDVVVRKIDWGLLGNWMWMGAFALLGIMGLGMIVQSRKLLPKR